MKTPITTGMVKEMCARFEQGVPPKVIAQDMRISVSTVLKWLQRAGAREKGSRSRSVTHIKNNSGESLCWHCALSALGDKSPCPWHRKEHTPRKDWVADRKDLYVLKGKNVESYIVKSCPAFVRG